MHAGIDTDAEAAAARFAERAARDGLADVAYAGFDSPYGEIHIAVTDRGLVSLALPNVGEESSSRPSPPRSRRACSSCPRGSRRPARARRVLRRHPARVRPRARLAADPLRLLPLGAARDEEAAVRRHQHLRRDRRAGGQPPRRPRRRYRSGHQPDPAGDPVPPDPAVRGVVGQYGGGPAMKQSLLLPRARCQVDRVGSQCTLPTMHQPGNQVNDPLTKRQREVLERLEQGSAPSRSQRLGVTATRSTSTSSASGGRGRSPSPTRRAASRRVGRGRQRRARPTCAARERASRLRELAAPGPIRRRDYAEAIGGDRRGDAPGSRMSSAASTRSASPSSQPISSSRPRRLSVLPTDTGDQVGILRRPTSKERSHRMVVGSSSSASCC